MIIALRFLLFLYTELKFLHIYWNTISLKKSTKYFFYNISKMLIDLTKNRCRIVFVLYVIHKS